MAKKTSPAEKKPTSRPSFIGAQIATFKERVLELLPQGWTVRRILTASHIEGDQYSVTFD
jgi:hypothetical protein